MDIGNLYRRAESAHQLDGPSRGIQRRILGAVDRTPTTQKIADALRGSLVGHPLHPALVTVPAGAWTASVIFDFFVREPETARRLIALGLITTPPVLMTGWLDWSERSDTARRVGLVHAAANGVGIISFIASYRLRACETGTETGSLGSAHRSLRSARLLSLIGLTAVSVGGALGGHIVFRLMDTSTSV